MSTPPPYPPPQSPGVPPPRRPSPWLAIGIIGGLIGLTLAAAVVAAAILFFKGPFSLHPPIAGTPPVEELPPPPPPPSTIAFVSEDAPAPTPAVEREPLPRGAPPSGREPHESANAPGRRPIAERPRPMPAREPEPAPADPVRAGGAIRPTKIRDVRPVYPDIAQRARVQGVVILEARIGLTGKVENLRVLRSIPLLDEAAIEAVRQWEYEPTLLNGVAVPVIMTVTVNFALQ